MGAPDSDDRRLLGLVGEVFGILDIDEFRVGLLEALLRFVPAKFASLNDVGPDFVSAIVEPDLDRKWFELFAAYVEQNPLFQHWQRTRDGRPYRFSDVAGRAELEATDLYQKVYEPLGIHNQIAMSLPGKGDRVLAVAMSRGADDFTDSERELLSRARPYLIQAYSNAIAYSGPERDSPRGMADALGAVGLTGREADVVCLIATGRSNSAAADALAISERTVQKHLERAYRKLGVANRTEAADRAWELSRSPLRKRLLST